jgi:hypothetical protein
VLTPAPDTAAVAWKKAALAAGQHEYTDIKTERIERAIADDVESPRIRYALGRGINKRNRQRLAAHGRQSTLLTVEKVCEENSSTVQSTSSNLTI